jgi:hypothetical protein
MDLETVFQTFNIAEAELVRSRLDAAGFDAQVTHELSALSMEGYSMTTGGVRVEVPSEQAKEARQLIASSDQSAE